MRAAVRAVAVAGVAAVFAVPVAGCVGGHPELAESDCSFPSTADIASGPADCTVTFARGQTRAEPLGLDVVLLGAGAEQVTVRLGGSEFTLPAGGPEVHSGRLRLRYGAVSPDAVTIHLARDG